MGEALCRSLKYLEDMVCLDVGHQDVVDVTFASYMPNLEYLIIADDMVKDISPLAGLKKLKYLEILCNQIEDISPLAECPALEDLNMCYNPATDASPLFELEHLSNLWTTGYFFGDEQMAALQEHFPDAKFVFHIGWPVSLGWHKLPNYYAQRDLLGMWYMED